MRSRRRFDHLFEEICLAVDRVVPRYALWMRLKELEFSPEGLTREAAIAFCDAQLEAFLAECGCAASPRRLRRLRRQVARCDPSVPTPYERFANL